MPSKNDDTLIGKEIGRCRIERKLGAGGMGAVYLGQHHGLNRPVAIKVLPPELASSPEFIERFMREARLAARLEHPNVVQVYDVGTEQGIYYITMQYVEGRSLDAILREKKKFAVGESIAVVKRIAVALAAAHRLGIVHRDIKPANILLSRDGVIKVADFGLAKDTDSNRTVSGTGQIVGTPYYMSPEQAQGLTVDHRSDLYSLGATLYHLLTGRRPFEAPTPLSIVLKHVNEEPVSPRQIDPTIPEKVCVLLSRMMAKKPDDRPATAEDLVREIDALKSGPASTVRAAPPKKSLRRAAMIALPIAGILLVGIVLGAILARGDSKTPVAVATPEKAHEKKAGEKKPEKPAEKPPDKPSEKPFAKPTEKPSEKGGPMDSVQKILGRIKDVQERRATEELMGRTDDFLKAVQKKDIKGLRAVLDKLTFGDLSDAQLGEIFSRLLAEKVELERWEFEDVQVRKAGPFGRPTGTSQMTIYAKVPKGEIKLTDQQSNWIRRLDGWYLLRPPNPSDK